MRGPEGGPEGVPFYNGPFSNFYPGPFVVWFDPEFEMRIPDLHADADGMRHIIVPTIEHFFQAAKATTVGDFRRIMSAPSPAHAKAAGRAVTLRDDWEQVKYGLMLIGLRSKFTIPFLRTVLLGTGTQYIYEASPTDAVWGLYDPRTGTWTGQNLLGRALMRVRQELRDIWGPNDA